MGLLSVLGKVGMAMLDGALATGFKNHVLTRPVIFHSESYETVKPELESKIAAKWFEIKAETSEGWKSVGLIKQIDSREAHYSPSTTNNFKIHSILIRRNHTGQLVAQAEGYWVDSGMSVS